jgi:hypothetical protein
MNKRILLASGVLVLTGCIAPNLSPTTYRCTDSPGFPRSFNEKTSERTNRLLPGVEPGMTREQVRAIFQELRHDPEIAKGVTLDDSNPEFLYFLAGTCPHLRYRFKNDRLVAAGRLGMEAGFWTYIGRDFTETRCDISRTESGEYHWFRTGPQYDQHGHFIGIEKIDDGPLAKGSLRLYLRPWETRASDVPLAERNFCKGMKAPGP